MLLRVGVPMRAPATYESMTDAANTGHRHGEGPSDRTHEITVFVRSNTQELCLRLEVAQTDTPTSTYYHCRPKAGITSITFALAIECAKPRESYVYGFVADGVDQVEIRIGRGKVTKAETIESPMLSDERLRAYIAAIPGQAIPLLVTARDAQGRVLHRRRIGRGLRRPCRGDSGAFYASFDD